ncbi:NifB/NifX family molybdenum-iron cluster-binding protein [Petroclostridium sp. X23]|uniref:NifB/NifX family molybdenum-iron cluster-binding protein n=1 Tax=Petroclostridium sp. X23 TaxID=3045146 RepID=UPI0024AD7286|nr:NifB/NifX family molybdenum-iron cluster-binding protein [Petroclostridium sp. X23]WHH57778.1 NifB/NifX family molybdenum-iron cluster-binding protein [Petroclostridium sp. X23]
MKIAVAADGKSLDSKVSEEFEQCLYLLIVNMGDLSITAIKNDKLSKNTSGESLANEILKYDCEALITGEIKPLAFNILADACVTRFLGTGSLVQNALELMEKDSLKIIRNCDGTDECSGKHH